MKKFSPNGFTKKTLFPILLGFIMSTNTYAQPEIEYAYDNAGNRIQRKVVSMPSGIAQQNGSTGEKTQNLTPSDDKALAVTDQKGGHLFELYPNPVKSELTIRMSDSFMNLKSKQLYLYDLKGVELDKKNVDFSVEKFDFSNYPAGSYIVRLIAEQGFSQEWRIVKE